MKLEYDFGEYEPDVQASDYADYLSKNYFGGKSKDG